MSGPNLGLLARKLGESRITGPTLTRQQVAAVVAGLDAVVGGVSTVDLHRRSLGDTAVAAVRELQTGAGLPVTGTVDEATLRRLTAQLGHAHVSASTARTRTVQRQLATAGLAVDAAEVTAGRYGPSTTAALRQFQTEQQLVVDGLAGPATRSRLGDRALAVTLRTKTQTAGLQRLLLRAGRVRRLHLAIDADEMKARTQGPSTIAALHALQTSLGLPVSDVLDTTTYDRIRSVAASVRPPAPRVARPDPRAVRLVRRPLRLNATGSAVVGLQEDLAFLGHPPVESERAAATFGASTRRSVLAFQAAAGLRQTGAVDGPTRAALNRSLAAKAPVPPPRDRIRGTLRDAAWAGVGGATVTLSTRPVSGPPVTLGTRTTLANGFYDLPYSRPTDPASGQPVHPLSLQVSFSVGGAVVGTKALLDPSPVAWVNFTEGPYPYAGPSQHTQHTAAVAATGAGPLAALSETAADPAVTRAAQAARLSQDDVMRLVLAVRVASELGGGLDDEACYALLVQGIPPTLPTDLLAETADWTLIEALVDRAAVGIAFTDPLVADAAWDAALAQNLVPVVLSRRREALRTALAAARRRYALDQPLLVGNGTLRAVLAASTVPVAGYDVVADAFVSHGGLGEPFWRALAADPAPVGGSAALADLRTGVEVGVVAKNHPPLVTLLRSEIADAAEPALSSPRDLAKLDPDGWLTLLTEHTITPPEGTDGDTPAARLRTFAQTLTSQGERLFPTTAVTAEVARSTTSGLTRITEISTLVDDHPDLDLRADNLAAFARSAALALDDPTRSELRVLQRVHRLAPTATAARALLESGLHSSMQLVSLGRAETVRRLAGAGVDERTAGTIAGYAEYQYAQVLARLGELRTELNQLSPRALAPGTITAEQRAELLGEIPDLDLLFGPVDVCDCPECASVYSPAAYLADLLRFLGAHPAETAGTSVLDVLGARRPDLLDVRLDCPNTTTPVPHIDLVNELLEAAVPGSAGGHDRQTTWTAAELRAAPEHVDRTAYEVLRSADLPLSSSFDLWQEETRLFTGHLGVPRWRLMEAFGVAPAADVAAERLGISSHEAPLITTAQPGAQDALWGFDASRPAIGVLELLARSQLSYPSLLLLLQTGWITPTGDPRPTLFRPADVADLGVQEVRSLSTAVLDRVHRLQRVTRHTGWDLWQVDLLVRAERIGAGDLDATGLTALADAVRLAERLDLDPETLATWFGTMPTDGHPDPADPTSTTLAATSRYAATYTDRSVLDPPDPALDPPSGGDVDAHRPALLAALAVTDAQLSALVARTGTTMDLPTLSRLAGWVELARVSGLDLSELLLLVDLLAPLVPDPFAGPRAMTSFLDTAARALPLGLPVAEVDHLLNARPTSPLASSDAAVTASLVALREALRSSPAEVSAGQVASYLAGALRLTPAQTQALLAGSDSVGRLADAFAEPAFVARDEAGAYTTPDVTPALFPRLHLVYRRLQKMARVVEVTHLDAASLDWLLAHADAVGALRLTDLPVDTAPTSSLLPAWVALAEWQSVSTALTARAATLAAGPGAPATPTVAPHDLVTAVAGAVPLSTVRGIATSLTGLDDATLAALDGGTAARYAEPAFLVRLADVASLVDRLGVAPATCLGWARREAGGGAPSEADIAEQVIAAAKAKYELTAWREVLTPLQDTLREAKRSALQAFLLDHAVRTQPVSISVAGRDWRNPAYWGDEDDLMAYFCVDVAVSSCQQTSRIKQAIGAVQMFVQRCLLNLERPAVLVSSTERADTTSLDAWSQWPWLKSYRLWEANRKVFLYPENWITPELRDDKTPFFVEFENELQGADVTDASAELALRHYLEKVDDTAHLDVVGIHHEVADDNPYDALPPVTNVLHVVARTRHDPARYYYRTFDLNEASWTPWERVDVDIAAEQVLPVVYNRTLHLFWLQITEKATKTTRQPAAQPTTGTKPAPEPPRQLEIKLCWSVRTGEGWTTRRQGPQTLVHPWQRPAESYTIKPRHEAGLNRLWIDVYLSMSQEFNNTKFWDPYTGTHGFVTARRFDETARPWHSSSFVFDGGVVDLRLKPLAGQYHVLDGAGVASEALVPSSSYAYVRSLVDPTGKVVRPLQGGGQVGARIALPEGMHLAAGRFVNNTWTPNLGRLAVLEQGGTVPLLTAARPPFATVATLQNGQVDAAWYNRSPFFATDAARAYFVTTAYQQVYVDSTTTVSKLLYTFSAFDHPYTGLFLRELNRTGADGLLNRRIQTSPQTYPPVRSATFAGTYAPVPGTTAVADNAATDVVDFSRSGAMSIYNWELFFHAPLMIACKLMTNQRFEEALSWFHRIFDPTSTDGDEVPQRFWITRPFHEQNAEDYRAQRIEAVLADIGSHLEEVRTWKNNPFRPDVIARFRPVAYQKVVVMRYLDNLIAWADQLFSRDTLESINEATLLYVLAGEILGRRPEHVPAVPRPGRSFAELTADAELDVFGNGQVEVQLENFTERPTVVVTAPDGAALPVLALAYFQIPANTQLSGYWDTVADRLFKIRHCMNLAGVVRVLPLFEAPLDLAALLQAVAGGVDLDSVLSDNPAAGSPYRYRTLWGRAMELASEVRVLGERMLSALERRDAEALAVLQGNDDVGLQNLVGDVRVAQVAEAERVRDGLEASRTALQARIDYYTSQPLLLPPELSAMVERGTAVGRNDAAVGLQRAAAITAFIPNFNVGIAGFGGSPTVGVSFGGSNISSALSGFAALNLTNAGSSALRATNLDVTAAHVRQFTMNQFQAQLATAELAQLEKQLLAAEARIAVAEHEVAVQEARRANALAVRDHLHDKYTNTALFDWMVGQLSTVYFQAYQLAFELARKAERAARFELGDQTTPPMIQFGYWDSLKKGLLAGDRLANDLRRLESSWLDRSHRRLQATTHISLATSFPERLLELTTSGSCSIDLPEWVFAAEHPGWTHQRILGVAVTVPGTTGPFVGVHATLTLTQAVVRTTDSVTGGFGDGLNAPDARFSPAMSVVTSIVTSHGSQDRGALPGNGLADDRYTAFEGAGVISRWTLTLDRRDNAFDLSTVSDVVLTVDHEGRQGGPALVDLARQAVAAAVPTAGARLLTLDREKPVAWQQMLHPAGGAEQVLTLSLSGSDLSYRYRQLAQTRVLRPVRVELVLDSDHTGQFDVRVAPPGQALPAAVPATADPALGGLHHATVSWPAGAEVLFGDWHLSVKRDDHATWTQLDAADLHQAFCLVVFAVT